MQQQVSPAPTTPRLKPILKNSNSNMAANAAGATPTSNISQQQQQPSSTPVPVPPPAPTIVPAVSSATVDVPAVDSSATKQGAPANDGDDPRWTEDDPSKWADTDEHGAWMDTEDGQQERPKWRRFKKLAGSEFFILFFELFPSSLRMIHVMTLHCANLKALPS